MAARSVSIRWGIVRANAGCPDHCASFDPLAVRRVDKNRPTSTRATGDRGSKAAHELPQRRSLAVRLQGIWDVHLERWDSPDWALASLYACAYSQAGRYADRCKRGNSPKPKLTCEAAAAGCLHSAASESSFAEVGM